MAVKLNFKQWKRGLLISLLEGLFAGIVALAIDVTWNQVLMFIAIYVAKSGGQFIKLHPAEEIVDGNTTTIVKQTDGNNDNVK